MAATGTQAPTRLTREEWRELLRALVEGEIEPLRKRRSRRYDIYGGEVRISAVTDPPDSRVFKRTVGILNVSLTGMMLKTYSEFPTGVDVALDVRLGEHRFWAAGRVKHCSQTLGGYKIGVELIFA
jgi:hypothetical protein